MLRHDELTQGLEILQGIILTVGGVAYFLALCLL